MRDRLIYTAGAMSGVDFSDAKEWGEELRELISQATNDHWSVFNPCLHVSDFHQFNMTDKEMMDYDIYHLLHSDLVVLNFAYNAKSVGTIAEMGIAYANHIPIIGLNEDDTELHPWQRDMCVRVFSAWQSMVNYIIVHYINER